MLEHHEGEAVLASSGLGCSSVGHGNRKGILSIWAGDSTLQLCQLKWKIFWETKCLLRSLHLAKLFFKIKLRGQQHGWVGTGSCRQAWQPELQPQVSHGRRRELTCSGSSPTSRHTHPNIWINKCSKILSKMKLKWKRSHMNKISC